MLVVGENEVKNDSLSIRKRGQGDLGTQPIEQVIGMIQEEIKKNCNPICSYKKQRSANLLCFFCVSKIGYFGMHK